MAIWITFVWILWEIGFVVYMAVGVRPLTPAEWILAGVGAAVATAALVAEFLEREKRITAAADEKANHAKELADARLDHATGNAYQSGKTDMAALMHSAQFRDLAITTNTKSQPAITVIEAANTTISALASQIKNLELAQWRRVSPIQKKKFVDTLQNMKIENNFVELFVVDGDAEAQSYAMELSRLLHAAGFVCGSDPIRRTRDFGPFDNFGLLVLVKNAKSLSSNAQWLIRGLEYSEVEYHVTNEGVVPNAREDYLAIRVGPKPE
jgi:uncharacterized protein YecA (UPF0149 family)